MCLDLANAFCFPILGTICSFLHICDFPLRETLNDWTDLTLFLVSKSQWIAEDFFFNSWFHRSFKSAKRKYHTKLSFWNLGKAIPLVIYLSARKPSRCGCRKIYNQNRPLIKTLLQQQRNSGLFHPAKRNLHILVYNSIFYSALFRGDSLLFPVCLRLLLGWCHHHGLCTAGPNLSLRNTKELVQLLSHSRLASDSTLEAQTLHKLPIKSQPSQLHSFKSHYCSHSWLNSSAFLSNEKKKSRLHWTTSRRFLHPQSISILS